MNILIILLFAILLIYKVPLFRIIMMVLIGVLFNPITLVLMITIYQLTKGTKQ